jgi:hypothetical protein
MSYGMASKLRFQNAIYWVWKELANTSDSIVKKVVKTTGFSLSKKSVERFS